MSCRSCRLRAARGIARDRVVQRFAHAAAAPRTDEDHVAPRRIHRRSASQASFDDYRFPDRGRNGGQPDPYEILSLERTASESDIKQQYYRLAKLLHPDSAHPSSSAEHFASLSKAYNLLSQEGSRSLFLQSGYGWNAGDSLADAQMRAEVALRRRGGAASWGHNHPGYRGSDAGRGAWGGVNGQGQWEPHDFEPMQGTGEARYMSNPRFLVVVGAVVSRKPPDPAESKSIVTAWIQYHRLGWAAETHRELLEKRHAGASQALAEARQEAALHGRERRERIRRRVRETEVLKVIEELEHQGDASHRDIGPLDFRPD